VSARPERDRADAARLPRGARRLVRSLDPQRRVAILADGTEMPSDLLLAGKAEFGASRVRRWFDRNWTSY
jgi:hypothetical protein